MRLTDGDLRAIGEIVAERYFRENNWRYVNLRRHASRIYRSYEDIADQYKNCEYMTRDWYVENSADREWHMCTTWQELRELVDFLRAHGQYFDFMFMKNNTRNLCIIARDDMEDTRDSISKARALGYGVYVVEIDIPAEIEFNVLHATGGTKKQ